MRGFELLTIIGLAFTSKVSAECFSAKLGYSCCTTGIASVKNDENGYWGIENDEWCGVASNEEVQECWSAKFGYKCCDPSTEISFEDEKGKWGIDGSSWCGIVSLNEKKSEQIIPDQTSYDFQDYQPPEWDSPVEMEVPTEGYMSKLDVVNTCPPEAKIQKSGVTYSKAEKITYHSYSTNVDRKMNIILPANYTTEKKYPVLYYLHGIFSNEDGLLEEGMGTIEIYNNLVNEGKAKEMIIVLPNTYAPADGVGVEPGFTQEHFDGYDNFINELINEIMPYIESNYSVATGRENTALAGFSMGGRNTLYIGFTHPELFGYLGAFSPAPGVFPIEGEQKGLMQPEELKAPAGLSPFVTMVSVGTKDFVVMDNPNSYHKALANNNEEHIWFTVPGAMHDGDAVSAGYYNFIQYLWNNLDNDETKLSYQDNTAESPDQTNGDFPEAQIPDWDAPVEMEVPTEGYMSKLNVVNTCPPEAKIQKSGVTYSKAEKITYHSYSTNVDRKMNIILPANYTTEKKYPVLYYLHGILNNEDGLLEEGMGTIEIYNNLVNEGKAKEMIIVLPNTYAPADGVGVEPSFTQEHFDGYDNFINELINEIMPYIESNYSVATGRENTALAGFSMGGRNTLYIGFTHPELFGYLGAFSPAPGVIPAVDLLTGEHKGLMQPEDLKVNDKRYEPLVKMISVGTKDFVVSSNPHSYHEALKANGEEHIWFTIPGAMHDSDAVSAGYYNFIQYLWNNLDNDETKLSYQDNTTESPDQTNGDFPEAQIPDWDAPVEMEVPTEGYMSKLNVVNTCPPEAKIQKSGVTYSKAEKITYHSYSTNVDRKMNIILPANYTTEKKYPVLYYLHGILNNEDGLLEEGMGTIEIYNNLINEGKAKEMIIVLPNTYAPADGVGVEPSFTQEHFDGYDNFINELINEIMPYVESNYSVATGRENTALAGFSMGGRNTLYIGFTHPELFGYLGAFSPAPGVFPIEGEQKGLMQPEELKAPAGLSPFVTMVSVGTKDFVVMDNPNSYHKALANNNEEHIWFTVPGAMHDGDAVSAGYYNFIQYLWNNLDNDETKLSYQDNTTESPDQTNGDFPEAQIPDWDAPVEMEVPTEGYMSKLNVVNTCPPEAKIQKSGVTYSKAEKITYHSYSTNVDRKMNIILPANYTTEKKYPVLYYLHGILNNEDGLLEEGMGTIEIYNNLVNEGKAKEMIIVLPNTYAPADGVGVEPSFTQEHFDGYDNFINELINEIMPYVESNYSVATGRENTALAGFSMGGRNTLYIGFTHPELFGYLGAFSPAPGVFPIEGEQKGLMQPEELKAPAGLSPFVTMVSVGTKDFVVMDNPNSYHKALANNNEEHIWFTVPGAMHDGDAVSAGYYNFIQYLWNNLDNDETKLSYQDNTTESPDQTNGDFPEAQIPDWDAPVEMEVPTEGYMSKLNVVNTCPPEAKIQKSGVTYSKAEKITYHSYSTNVDRKMNIILPANYTTEKKYPVLYYLHGILNNEDGLLEEGMGTIEIYNNLVNEGKAKEMIIVLPNTYAPADGVGVEPSFTQEHFDGYDNFINELINEIMPYVESNYSVATGRENTALAGFSMGGRNTLYIGFTHPELFGYLGAFSPAPGVFPIEGEQKGLMQPEELKAPAGLSPFVTMVSVGTKDFVVMDNPNSYHKALANNNEEHIWFTVPGAMHDSDAVSAGYYNFIQYLWNNLDNDETKLSYQDNTTESPDQTNGNFPEAQIPDWDAPVEMEVPTEGYMSKLNVVNACPPEAKIQKSGVTYSKAEKITYHSYSTNVDRKMNIILPANYTTEKKYPVLYYLHGILNNEDGLLEEGMGTIEIYNNLVNEGKAKEMIIVLPNTYAPADGVGVEPSFTQEHFDGYDNFINELINEIMPYIESNYSVATGRENTALAGFSMGGRNTLYIGFTHPELFGYLGAFSPAPGVFPIEGEQKGLMQPEELKAPAGLSPFVTMVSVGTKDFVVMDNPNSYHKALANNNEEHIWFTVPGAMHDGDAVSAGYYNFIQYLWNNLDNDETKLSYQDNTTESPDQTNGNFPEAQIPDWDAPVEMEVPTEGYMSELNVVNTCPPEAKIQKSGVTYSKAEKITYHSYSTNVDRKMNIILPANYTTEKKYPVLYYLHGILNNEDGLLEEGMGTIEIYNNLVNEGKAKEMIIVLPNTYAPADGVGVEPSFTQEHFDGYDNFINELINEIMPYVESNYSVATGRENTALAGFSMGGRNTLYIGFTHPELFGYLGAFSPAPGVFPIEGEQKGLMQPEELKAPAGLSPFVTMVSVGTKDFVVMDNPNSYHKALANNNEEHIWFTVPGAMHDGDAVSAGYYNFIQYLWNNLDNDETKLSYQDNTTESPDQTNGDFPEAQIPDWDAPVEMEVPTEGYMSKLNVVNTCPPEAKIQKSGVTYSKAEKITYHSYSTNVDRKMNIILPANYTTEKKYPVLYYLHGILNNEDGLLEEGMGTIEIYNNLVNEGKAKEMIIVLPNTYAPADGVGVEPSFTQEHFDGYDNFINELINEIMPYIESNYSVATGRENTALAGFSMGGRNTLYIGFTHPELFGYLGAFSPAPGVIPAVDLLTGEHKGLMQPEDLKVNDKRYEPLVKMISVGTKDFVVSSNPHSYHEALKANGEEHIWFTIPGAMHDSDAVSAGYYNFIQYLWNNLDN